MQGCGGSSRGGIDHVGVGWVLWRWGGSFRGGVGNVGLMCIMQGWNGVTS